MTEPIALVCAMPMELTPLVKRLKLRKETVGGVPLRTGALDGRPVVALHTGMGTDLATTSTERLLDAVTPSHLIVFGITGAVDDDVEIGALVRPAVVVHSETGAEHTPAPLGGEPMHGTMWTTNVMTPASELPALIAKGVVSLDMETAAIADSCERRGVPWSVVRSISDRATDDTIDEEVFHLAHQDGRPNPRGAALRGPPPAAHPAPRLDGPGRRARRRSRPRRPPSPGPARSPSSRSRRPGPRRARSRRRSPSRRGPGARCGGARSGAGGSRSRPRPG